MALTLDKIESLAPDQASLAAARKLLKASSWPGLFTNSAGLVWESARVRDQHLTGWSSKPGTSVTNAPAPAANFLVSTPWP
jgi:hypothetical protein